MTNKTSRLEQERLMEYEAWQGPTDLGPNEAKWELGNWVPIMTNKIIGSDVRNPLPGAAGSPERELMYH